MEDMITYSAYKRPGDGAYFWVTKEHAGKIARTLKKSLKYFALEFTTFEPGAWKEFVDHLPQEITVDELVFSHQSGDEMNEEEAQGIKDTATKLNSKIVRVWASEFDKNAADALEDFKNKKGVELYLETI